MNAISTILVLTLTVSVVCGMTLSTRDNVDVDLIEGGNIRKRDEIMDNLKGVPGADVVSGGVLQKRDEIIDNLNGVPGSDIVKRNSECVVMPSDRIEEKMKTCEQRIKEKEEREKKEKEEKEKKEKEKKEKEKASSSTTN